MCRRCEDAGEAGGGVEFEAGSGRRRQPRAQRGAILLFVMLSIALWSAAATMTLVRYSTDLQRWRTEQRIHLGREVLRALESYLWASPGPRKELPTSFADLLLDPRHLTVTRHLRRLVPDPVTGSADWAPVRLSETGPVVLEALRAAHGVDILAHPDAIVGVRFPEGVDGSGSGSGPPIRIMLDHPASAGHRAIQGHALRE